MRLFSTTAAALATAAVQLAAQQALSLEEAIRLATAHNSSIERAALAEQQTGDQIEAAKTRRLPSFKFSSTTGQLLTRPSVTFEEGAFGTFDGIGPVPGKATKITSARRPATIITAEAALPLTQQYGIGLEIQKAELGRKIAGEQVRLTRQQVVAQVRETYYSILQAQSSLDAVDHTLRLLGELAATTGRYVKVGTALDADLLAIRSRLAQAESDKAALEGPLATQKERLNQLMGRGIETEFHVVPALEAGLIPELAEARVQALASRPEIEQARLRLRQAETDRRIKKSEYIPDVSLSGTYFTTANLSSTPSNIAMVGVSVQWEPFDWGRKRHELAAHDKVAEQAALAMRETEDKVRIEVGSAYRKMRESRLRMAAARAEQDSARESARLASVRYRNEAALLQTVLEAETTLAAANDRAQKALLAYWSARAEMEKAMGVEQ